MKTLFKILVVLIVLAGGAVWFLASNLDDIVRKVIENVGTETLRTEVSLASAKIDLGTESAAALNDLTIANPPGYAAPYAFELGTIGASVDVNSLSGDVIVIPNVLIGDARLTFEQTGADINLQTLANNMDSDSGSSGDAGGSDTAVEGEDVLLAIGELTLTGTTVTVISDQLGEPFEFKMSEVVVKNIGTTAAGVTPEQAAERILDPVIDTVMKDAKGELKNALEARVNAEIEAKKAEAKAELEAKKSEKEDELKQSLRDKLRGN